MAESQRPVSASASVFNKKGLQDRTRCISAKIRNKVDNVISQSNHLDYDEYLTNNAINSPNHNPVEVTQRYCYFVYFLRII